CLSFWHDRPGDGPRIVRRGSAIENVVMTPASSFLRGSIMMASTSRRRFLRSSAAIAAATTLPAWFLERASPARAAALAANDKPAVALIGCGGRGRAVAG